MGSSGRARYLPSGRVDWRKFIPWAAAVILIAIMMAAGLNWVYQRGWYLFIFPVMAGVIGGILVLLTVTRGKCRSPVVGTLFGFVVGVVIFAGHFYFGMLSLLGPGAAGRLDLFPKYLSLQLRTNLEHNLGAANTIVPPDPYMNGFRFCLEGLMVLAFTTLPGYRRSGRSFCERCGKWKRQDLAIYPPGNGKTIAQWLRSGDLARLAEVPPYLPRGRGRQATLVALERCQPMRTGCSYYLAVKDATSSGGLGRFDSGFGRIRVPRVELTVEEVAALTSVFPAVEFPTGKMALDAAQLPAELAGSPVETVEIEPIPPHEARRVLTRFNITVLTLLTLSILLLFYAGIIGFIVGIDNLSPQLSGRFAGPSSLRFWLIFAAASAFVAVFSVTAIRRNMSVIGNRYLRFVSRRSIARRRQKWVDPGNTRGLPTHFVQAVPRQNWGTLKLETARDVGFLQVDSARNELRFEGDVERWRLPGSAIIDCSIASYSTNPKLRYYVVVLQGRSVSGTWEAPVSIRPTGLFAAKNVRHQLAIALQDQITQLLPVMPLAAGSGEALPVETAYVPLTPDYAHVRPTDLKARPLWVSRFSLSLAIVLAGVSWGIWRGIAVQRQRQNMIAQFMANSQIESGANAPRLGLTIKKIYFKQQMTGSAPYHQPGGDWTVLDCASGDGLAGFTIGVERLAPFQTGLGPAFQVQQANVALLPSDRKAAGNLVAKLAAALNQPAPPAQPAQPLVPTNISTAVLGDHLGDPRHGLKRGAGSWTALLWSFEQDGLEGQIYFNYNLFTQSAELVSGGGDMDADALTGIASAIRDGPEPARSEQNDPTFTLNGPIVTDLQLVPNSQEAAADFSGNGNLLVYYDRSVPGTIRAVDLRADRRLITIAQFDGRVQAVFCADGDDDHFLVVENMQTGPVAVGQQQELRIWWVDRSSGNRTQITGPWGLSGLLYGQHRISPDRKYCAISALSGTILDSNRVSSLYLVNLQTGNAIKADRDQITPISWRGVGDNLRCVAVTDDKGEKLSIDPVTGQSMAIPNQSSTEPATSPDGQLSFSVDPQKCLTINPLNGSPSRVLYFGPRDRRYAAQEAFRWLSPRYLRFMTTRDGFVDVEKLKVGYLPTPPMSMDEDGFEYNRPFNWAYSYAPGGIMLGRVVLPEEAQ
jgi:hypothetical protein